jgi:hypothetical protein
MSTFKLLQILQIFPFLLFSSGVHGQGFDAGPIPDPLRLGLIDPVALELGATYLFVAPFVIFVLGILIIPVSLVFLILIIIPLYVPTANSNPAHGRAGTQSFRDVLKNSECLDRIICEISGFKGVEELSREPIR